MKLKQLLIFLILFAPITIYLLFKEQIKPYWENFDTFFTITSYSVSIVLFLYTLNLKFHFAINKFLSWFKQDHTYWFFSYSFELDTPINNETLIESFRQKNIQINKAEYNFFEFIYKDIYIFRVQKNQNSDGEETIHLFTNKIIVPSKYVKTTINELIHVTDYLEHSLININKESKKFDLTIEYPNSSPFYSYWIKKLPEQSIDSFNFKIKVPNNNNSVLVNKNKILISSKSLNKLFDTTKDYLSLQIEI